MHRHYQIQIHRVERCFLPWVSDDGATHVYNTETRDLGENKSLLLFFFQIKLNHWNLQKTPQYGRYLYFMIFIALWVKKSPQRQRLYKLHMVTENVFLKVYGRNTSDHSTKFNHNNFNSIVRKNVTTSLMWKVFNDELKNPNSWLLWKLKETVLMSGAKQRLYVEHIY